MEYWSDGVMRDGVMECWNNGILECCSSGVVNKGMMQFYILNSKFLIYITPLLHYSKIIIIIQV